MKCYTGTGKLKARFNTIIAPYQELFQKSIPEDEQYWTLAGSVLDEAGNFNKESEINQILSANLIAPNQFFGVDKNKQIIDTNKQAYPKVNWIHNTLKDAILKAIDTHNFNPAIVNIDHVYMPKQACKDFKDIFKILTSTNKRNMLVVFNTLTTNPYNGDECNPNVIIDILNSDRFFAHYLADGGWNTIDRHYNYSGSGIGNKKRSKLSTILFWRK
jgi:hypothetical protein